MAEQILKKQEELATLIEQHAKKDGHYATAIPSLSFTRLSKITEPTHGIYDTSLCIIAQGAKKVLLGQNDYQYSPAHYLVASVDLPVTAQVTEASLDLPYLALKLEIQPSDILKVLGQSQIKISKKEKAQRGMYVSELEQPLLDAVIRMIRLLNTPDDIPALTPLIKEEIIYRLLQGEYGSRLKQLAIEGSSTQQVHYVIQYIMKNYDKSFKIEDLAKTSNMSVSSLYRYFTEVTAMSPIQFQKQLRLQKARSLLLLKPANAADVAFQVGYESPSQFSREYSRMFGRPPKEDIKHLEQELVEE